eukprot:scaffold689_cov375-Prasinococcus_capsulatus_cf.AAC.23
MAAATGRNRIAHLPAHAAWATPPNRMNYGTTVAQKYTTNAWSTWRTASPGDTAAPPTRVRSSTARVVPGIATLASA